MEITGRLKKIFTLCMIHDGGKILLGMKKRGFGEGKWNGFGGKVGERESIEDAALREIKEEANIVPDDLKKRGIITFEFEKDPTLLEVHVFSASKFNGIPKESEEMNPRWFELTSIPFHSMWIDDKHWLPVLLAGKNFNAYFLYRGHDTILSHNIREI